jgi:hypothetical protein
MIRLNAPSDAMDFPWEISQPDVAPAMVYAPNASAALSVYEDEGFATHHVTIRLMSDNE